jgi:general transcription factor 3C polypeptide 5 (transcription factor C subunit 1)
MTELSQDRLKYIIPAVAYYFTTGPWRNLWVRFGYDPRCSFDESAF